MMIYKELSFEQESANIKFLKHLPNYSQQVISCVDQDQLQVFK